MKEAVYMVIPLGLIAMMTGIYCGIIRIGQPLPSSAYLPVGHHGLVMTGSFLGTLICLERAAVYPDKRAWLSVILMAMSLPFFMLHQVSYGVLCLLAGSAGYAWISFNNYIKGKQRGDLIIATGAAFQLMAYIIFMLTNSYPNAFAGWLLFLILTIMGERLNLTRIFPMGKKALYEAYFWIFLLLISAIFYHQGSRIILGISLVGLAVWMLRHDIIRLNLKKGGHDHFLSLALLLAYLWLAVSGILSMLNMADSYLYDAVLHSFFVGFVLSVILAHAPVIFPGLVGIQGTPFHPVMYIWLAGLHASLVIRIYGDLGGDFALRKVGGIYNGVFFLAYIFTVIWFIVKFKQSKQ